MQFPVSWLREFCNPPVDDTALAEILAMAGMEVESMHPAAPPCQGVVVARIVAVEKHPGADRLRVCRVDTGAPELLQIVCGASNARTDLQVPCATVGAQLPTDNADAPLHVRVGKLREVESFGILCSAKELGMGEDTGGLLELPEDAPIGQDIRQYLDLDDAIFTLKLTPNLGHVLSVYGVARELSALTNTPLQPLPSAKNQVTQSRNVAVQIHAPDLCGRFSGRTVAGVAHNAPTPFWMVQRLARCGQRSVNALVDISNYVMFERGQPTHIFDADCIAGDQLHVRWAKAQETLTLLNGNPVALTEDVGVITDDEKIESLAGIMGGQASAVSANTHNVYIEAAFWWPEAIAGRARRFHFSTDAGYRFERGVDPKQTLAAIERITDLVQQVCGGDAGPLQDQKASVPPTKTLQLRVARAAKVIGMALTAQQCHSALARLGFAVQALAPEVLQVKVPSYRFDVTLEEDLIEEVIRLIGYDQLPVDMPRALLCARKTNESTKNVYALRRQLAQLGYFETINFGFVPNAWEAQLHNNPKPIRLLNPIATQMDVMRSSLMGSLLQTLQYNLDRKAKVVRIFEIGRVFWRSPTAAASTHDSVAGIAQPMRVAALLYGDPDGLHWQKQSQPADFYDAKGDIEALLWPRVASFIPATGASEHAALHPGRSAQIVLEDKPIGYVGELHPKHLQHWGFVQAPMLFELDLQACLQLALPQAQGISKFQNVQRDIAILLPEATPYKAVEQAIWQASHEGFLQKVELFDLYHPQAKALANQQAPAQEKSFAIRLTLASFVSTLTDAQIEGVVKNILQALAAQTGARLRG